MEPKKERRIRLTPLEITIISRALNKILYETGDYVDSRTYLSLRYRFNKLAKGVWVHR